jgi:tetratricopeptide (TPR) repeat protein
VAHAVRGASFVRKGDYDRALVDLNEALRLDPNNASVHNAFGVYYNAKGDHDRALPALNEAIRLNPRFLYGYRNRGVTHENRGDLNKALADFRVALDLDPDKRQTGGQEAAEGIRRVEQKLAAIAGADWLTCLSAPTREEGIPACTRLIAANKLSGSDLAQVHVWRGVANLRFKQDYELGLADFNEGLRRDPTIVGAYAGRAASYIGKNAYARALADLNEGLRRDPKSPGVQNVLGIYYLKTGEYDRALAQFN